MKSKWIDWKEFDIEQDALEFLEARDFSRRDANNANEKSDTEVR